MSDEQTPGIVVLTPEEYAALCLVLFLLQEALSYVDDLDFERAQPLYDEALTMAAKMFSPGGTAHDEARGMFDEFNKRLDAMADCYAAISVAEDQGTLVAPGAA